ncbi:unnamed protein product [Cylicostephanus goldi]|uniref:Uncharacterized protein n=1 Tax=Cylicostephanus goldi TaxID=71465 RepID=A0A3P6QYK1_CYLGO|nr:unnamed protein product [Cylicostephanus goldi]
MYQRLKTDENDWQNLGPPKWHLARRHFVAALALLGFANIYAMRANLSVAIVEMTSGTSKDVNGTHVHVDSIFIKLDGVVAILILANFLEIRLKPEETELLDWRNKRQRARQRA